jgi:hypothetical protein
VVVVVVDVFFIFVTVFGRLRPSEGMITLILRYGSVQEKEQEAVTMERNDVTRYLLLPSGCGDK